LQLIPSAVHLTENRQKVKAHAENVPCLVETHCAADLIPPYILSLNVSDMTYSVLSVT